MIRYIMNFLMGGLITTTISYLATFISPAMASLFWMMPWTLLPSIYFMSMHNKSNKYIGKFIKGSIYPLPILVITLWAFGYFYIHSSSKDIWIPMLKGSLIWFVSSVIAYFGIQFFNLNKYF